MAAHKYWQALCMAAPTKATLELSEFHLYSGVTRIDAAATLTANAAPTGALTNLKDDSTGTGCYWPSGGDAVVLTWEFASPQEVTGIVLGARTTADRWPTALYMRGGDDALGTGPTPDYCESMAFGVPLFVSATKTAVLVPGPMVHDFSEFYTSPDLWVARGNGYVPYITEAEVLPPTNPKTYTPQWARVQLTRFIDGRVVQEQWSNRATGVGAFDGVDENQLYTITAFYPDSGKRAVVADRLAPLRYPGDLWG